MTNTGDQAELAAQLSDEALLAELVKRGRLKVEVAAPTFTVMPVTMAEVERIDSVASRRRA